MRRPSNLFLLLALCFPLAFSVGCDFSKTENPTEPALCGDGVCQIGESHESCPADCPPPPLSCTAPSSVTATVRALPCNATDCTVSFSTNDSSYMRWSWSFPGCNPSSPTTSSGSVGCPRPSFFPASIDWSVEVCTSTAAEDPTGICCNGTSDRVNLTGG